MTSTIRTSCSFFIDLPKMPGNSNPSLNHGRFAPASRADRPLVAHVLNRFDVGGLETVVVELINATGEDSLRHVVICLSGYSEFRKRIRISGVDIYTLNKRPGKNVGFYQRLWKLLRRLRPDLVQTYNIGTIDAAISARLAGVRVIVHAEHGRSADDPMGLSAKYNLLRQVMNPFITRYVAVSNDLNRWLVDVVGLPPGKITRIYNGVQVPRPIGGLSNSQRRAVLPPGFVAPESIVFMNVGRLDPVKDQAGLIQAFAHAVNCLGPAGEALRLVIVGDGPESKTLKGLVDACGMPSKILMTGSRADVPLLLEASDIFVLSSVAEGIPMTILEAMACARPVIATAVGGNSEVVADGETGMLVPSGEPRMLAEAICRYVGDPELASRHGAAGRIRVAEHFSREQMVHLYLKLYRDLIPANSIRGRGA